jgi:hypothetical protein
MSASCCKIWQTPHSSPNCNSLCPNDRVSDLRPFGFYTICYLDQGLTNIEMGMLNKTIGPRIVSADMNMIDVISLNKIFDGSDKDWCIVGNNLSNRTPSAHNVLIQPVHYRHFLLFSQHAKLQILHK